MTRPIARPAAQRTIARNARLGAASSLNSTRNDSASRRFNYITADRLQRIAEDMTERDMEVLIFLSAGRLASGKQLVRRFFTEDPAHDPARVRAGNRALKRLADWRVIDPLPNRTVGGVRGGSSTLVYGVGVAGMKLLAGRGLHQKRLGTPGERHVRHTLACVQIVVDLHAAHARGELDLIEVQQEPACHRTFLGPLGGRPTLKPDLFARVGVGALEDRWFIECDLASEHPNTLLAKARRYIEYYRSGSEQRDHGVFPRVLWAASDERRVQQIEEVLRRLPAEAGRMFAVCLLVDVVGRVGEEARS
jgi:hypothetical protein